MKTNIIAFMLVLILSISSLPLSYAQGIITDTVVHRDLRIDLGAGLMTDAQLTFPTVGKGPFPGVLLIHGSGNIDMNGYLPPTVTGLDKPSELYLQIAEYLSERGFAVLRYNKRGIGLNGTILDPNVWGNMTFQYLVQDAEKAVSVLRQQPEVNANVITLIGHSEGTMIAPRIAIEDPAITKIVLMGAVAQNLRDIFYFQIVDRIVVYAEGTIDTNHDGLLSVEEVVATFEIRNVMSSPLPPQALIQNATGIYDWYPGLDADHDSLLSIQGELQPLLQAQFTAYTNPDPKSPFYSKWLQSDFALKDTNLALIGNVTASILILQGEADTQTPIGQALLLEQRLTELNHPDHTLISYPGLGHTFYPTDGWIQPLGPIQEYVLADLAAWLKDPARTVGYLKAEIQVASNVIKDLQNQLGDVNSELELRTSELQDAEKNISVLKDDLDTSEQEISSLEAELDQQTQNVKMLQDIQTQLTNDLKAANQEIDDQKSQLKNLQSKSSSLENTITELQERNSELETALDMSTIVAYIAIAVAIIAVIGAYTIRIRRKR